MNEDQNYRPSPLISGLFLVLAVVGGAALVVGFAREPERAWANLFLVANYLAWLGVGGLVLVALHYVTGARWSVPVRRIEEALAALLPAAALLLLIVLVGRPSLYGWVAELSSEERAASPLRTFWMARPFFLVRAVLYLGVWLAFARALVGNSRRQDRTGEPGLTRKNSALAAGFLVAFGLTCWLASYDWLMSLEPDWASTMFPVYNFAGTVVTALAAVTLLAVELRRAGPLRGAVTEDSLHDLGTLLFGMSCFWTYTWYCQFLLIWYANHPEETSFFARRWQGPWPAFVLANLALNGGVPFLVLLFRGAKRRPGVLAVVAVLVLAGRWLDLFVTLAPSQGEILANPGLLEAGFALGGVGLAGLLVVRALGQAPLVPVHDPWLVPATGHDFESARAPAGFGVPAGK